MRQITDVFVVQLCDLPTIVDHLPVILGTAIVGQGIKKYMLECRVVVGMIYDRVNWGRTRKANPKKVGYWPLMMMVVVVMKFN